ncbi:hypothetical protein [Pectinatus brassicae]|uniref:HMA domain-containing protein n=1 Tax=Pectinatus brassicae TaxID=862415 RepID=A0A840UCZ7_9FIRM|nr:hypothetical protein [Pectinatus brassicae]MBB5334946.1 hypothetical protein [Pectinatus brassicae]
MLKLYIEKSFDEDCAKCIIAALGDLEGMHKIYETNLTDNYISLDCSTEESILYDALKDEGFTISKIEHS